MRRRLDKRKRKKRDAPIPSAAEVRKMALESTNSDEFAAKLLKALRLLPSENI